MERGVAPARIEWHGREHEHRARGVDWYWGVGLAGMTLALAALLFGNALLALLIAITAAVLAVFALHEPKTARFMLVPRGLVVDDKLYPFQTLESFWIDDAHPHRAPKLIVKSSQPLMPLLVIPLEGVNIDAVHRFLAKRLPEEEQHEPFSHRLLEWLGF